MKRLRCTSSRRWCQQFMQGMSKNSIIHDVSYTGDNHFADTNPQRSLPPNVCRHQTRGSSDRFRMYINIHPSVKAGHPCYLPVRSWSWASSSDRSLGTEAAARRAAWISYWVRHWGPRRHTCARPCHRHPHHQLALLCAPSNGPPLATCWMAWWHCQTMARAACVRHAVCACQVLGLGHAVCEPLCLEAAAVVASVTLRSVVL